MFHLGFLSLQIQLKSLAEEMQSIIKSLEKVKLELVASENDGPVSEVFHKVSNMICSFDSATENLYVHRVIKL